MESTLAPQHYPSAERVFELLSAVEQGVSLHRAIASRLASTHPSATPMSAEAHGLIAGLVADGCLVTAGFQSELAKALTLMRSEGELNQQLKALTARYKTLELQLRNTEQELKKGGLFRGKVKQELALKASRLEAQLTHLKKDLQAAQDQRSLPDFLLKKAATEAAALPELSDARWLEADELVLALTPPGRFLFKALQELPLAHLTGKSLAQALTRPATS